MKKLISGLTLAALMGAMNANTEATQAEQEPVSVQLTVEEEAACRRILDELQKRYSELNLHAEIVKALQEVADSNRADFEVIRSKFGGQTEDGTWVWPVRTEFWLQ